MARRIAWSLAVVWAVVSITFVVDELLPGDPAQMVAGPQARPADVARIRVVLGLDRPPIVRYALFWKRLVHLGPRAAGEASSIPREPGGRPAEDGGHQTCQVVIALGRRAVHVDLGKSFQFGQPVVALVAARLPRTFVLAVAAVGLQLLLGVGAGVLAAAGRGTWIDRALVWASLLGISAPTFLLALFLQHWLAYRLRLLPIDGFGETFGDHARCLVLPALTLGIYGAAYYTRLARDEMIVLLRQDWVRTARAKGAGRARVAVVHALRNGLAPVVTAAGLDFGTLLGGAIVTEVVFRWPGLGDLSLKAATNRDGPVLMACVIVASVAIVACNLAADLVCRCLDRRLRG